MELNKEVKKPLILEAYKPIGGVAKILEDEGKVQNEGQTIKYVSPLQLQKDLKNLKSIWSLIRVKNYGGFDKEFVDAEIEKIYPKPVKSDKELLAEMMEQNKQLLEALKQNAPVDAPKEDKPKTDDNK